MNPYGEVVIETLGDIVTVNGHSWANKRTRTRLRRARERGLHRAFDDPIGYGGRVGAPANMLGKGVHRAASGRPPGRQAHHRGRLPNQRPGPPSGRHPGDLSFCIPYRILTDIEEMLAGLDKVSPASIRPIPAVRHRGQVLLQQDPSRSGPAVPGPWSLRHRRRRGGDQGPHQASARHHRGPCHPRREVTPHPPPGAADAIFHLNSQALIYYRFQLQPEVTI
jgi:hypothetical protein